MIITNSMTPSHPFPLRIRSHIIPAILAHSKKEFLDKLSLIKKYYSSNRFQIDVLDGRFVPYRAWCAVRDIEKMKLKDFDAHLMTHATLRHIQQWKRAGAHRIFIHYEAIAHPLPLLRKMQKLHVKAGIALNPETSPRVLTLLLPFIDAILLMGERPGYGGQKFRKSILSKIQRTRTLAPHIPVIIDGGVTVKSAPLLLKAGASRLASGHAALSPFEKNYEKNFSNHPCI